MQFSRQKGFTLVEIAIVLVIVGLLIGGVLKGQEMITNAKLKRVESDNAGIAAALFSYQDRYLLLPGDDDDAKNRFSIYSGDAAVTIALINGDGSGTIDGGWDGAVTLETAKIWRHLRASGLIPGDPNSSTRPVNAYGGKIGLRNGSLAIRGHVTIFAGIDGPIAKIIEGRLDDGDLATGRIQSSTDVAEMDGTTASSGAYSDDELYFMAFRL